MSYHAEGTPWKNKPLDNRDGLDERQIKMVQLLVSGEKTKGEIAEILGVHRNTITNWLKNDSVKALVAQCEEDARKQANSFFVSKAPVAALRLWEMAEENRSKNKDIARKIYSYFANRALGTPSGKMIVENTTDEDDGFDLDALVERFRNDPIPQSMKYKKIV